MEGVVRSIHYLAVHLMNVILTGRGRVAMGCGGQSVETRLIIAPVYDALTTDLLETGEKQVIVH